MKHFLPLIVLLSVIYASYAQNVKTIFPAINTEEEFVGMTKVVLPTIQPLWMKSEKGLIFGVLLDRVTNVLYICAYLTDPRNITAKEILEQWKLTDENDKNISLADIDWTKVKNLMLTSKVVYLDGNWVGSPYYFGAPISFSNIKRDTVRVHLPNMKLAFDYSIKTGEILQKYTIDVTTKLAPIK